MAVNYAVKFGQMGRLCAHVNELTTLESTTLPSDLADILTQYGTALTGVGNAQSQISGLTDSYLALMNAVGSMKSTLAGYAPTTMTDYDTVISQLAGASSQDLTTTLLLLYRDMIVNSQTVTRSTVTLGTVSATSGNIGTGTVLIDKQLDGFNSPVSGGPVNPLYVGVNSELAPPSCVHAWVCSSDSYQGAATAGAETFSWNDGMSFGPFDPHPEGAGAGPGITAAGGVSATTGGYFNTFGSNVPSGWAIVSGTAGTNILQDSTNFFGTNSTSSLQFVGDGSATTIAVNVPAGPSVLTPRRRYCVNIYIQRTSGAGASGVVNVRFTGTGYSAAASEQISVAASGLGATWTLYSFWITVPSNLPADFALQLSVTNTLDAATKVNFANCFTVPVTYFGGFNATLVGGKTPFAALDKFTATVTNDGAGLFQEFARVLWGYQFPSAPATPTPPGSYALLLPYSLFTGTGVPGSTLTNALAS